MPLPGLCLCRDWRLGVSSYKPSNVACFGHVWSCHTVWEAKTKHWARTLGVPVPGRLATNVFPHPAIYSRVSDKREAGLRTLRTGRWGLFYGQSRQHCLTNRPSVNFHLREQCGCVCVTGKLNNSALWCLQRKGFLDLAMSRPVVAPFSAGEPLGEPSLSGSSSAPALKQCDKRISGKHWAPTVPEAPSVEQENERVWQPNNHKSGQHPSWSM